MTVICKIPKCAFHAATLVIVEAVLLNSIAHPCTFLPRSHQDPTEQMLNCKKHTVSTDLEESDFAELWCLTQSFLQLYLFQ